MEKQYLGKENLKTKVQNAMIEDFETKDFVTAKDLLENYSRIQCGKDNRGCHHKFSKCHNKCYTRK